MRVDTCARPARGPSGTRATSALRVALVEDRDRRARGRPPSSGWHAARVTGTVLPFSTSGAMSSVTRPSRSGAPPVKLRMAAASASGVAAPGAAAARRRTSSSGAGRGGVRRCHAARASIAQRAQVGHHVLDLLRVEHRLALPGRRRRAAGLRCGGRPASACRGFRRRASTMRSRSCASRQRAPAPARSAARLPWKRSSAIGALWHSRHRPVCRLATMARPRAASPGAAVSGCGMPSPPPRRAPARPASRAAQQQPSSAGQRPHQARFRLWFFSGSSRMRLPVAAKIAFSTAGAATAMVGSPTPPQKPPEGMTIVSTFGISSMRSTG